MRYIVKAVMTFDDGINKGQLQIQANSEEEALDKAMKQLTETWKISKTQIEVTSVKKLGARMSDEQTEKSRTYEEVSKDLKRASEISETTPNTPEEEEALEPGGKDHVEPDGDENSPTEDVVMPEPKPKTPEEIAKNPEEAIEEDVLKRFGAK